MGFGEYQRGLVKAPWMQGPKARAFNGALGDAKQDALDELKAAVKARLPLDDAADDDLRLRKLGEQFALERYPIGETGAQYVARLQHAFDAHAKAGTSAAVVEQLEAFSGGADVRVVEDWEWHGAEGEWPSRCWVVIGPDLGRLGWQPLRLGSWVLGSGTLGSTATRAEIEAVVRIINKWRDLGALIVSVIVCWPNAPTLGLGVGPFVLGGGLGPSGAGDAVTWRVAPLLGDDNGMVLGAWTLGADLIA